MKTINKILITLVLTFLNFETYNMKQLITNKIYFFDIKNLYKSYALFDLHQKGKTSRICIVIKQQVCLYHLL